MAAFTETKTLSGIDCVIDYAHENDLRVSDEELQRYVDRDHQLNPYKTLQWMKLEVDDNIADNKIAPTTVPNDEKPMSTPCTTSLTCMTV